MKKIKFLGLSPVLAAALMAICFAAMYTGSLSKDLAGGFAIMLSIGIIFNEIGKRIPFWNTYVGGGLVLAFLGSAAVVYYKLIPEDYVKVMGEVTDDMGFLSFFIVMLITGSVLGLNRKMLLRSMAGYIPAILGGLVGAALLGIVTGLLFGINPADVVIKYVLPIMGGGNGAGAVPLSQIYERVTGQPKETYYVFAIAILTIANIFAILTAGVLNGIGKKSPSLTGDGKTLMRKSEEFVTEKEDVKVSMIDYGGAFFLALSFYTLGNLFSNYLLPTVFGTPIHTFAYMIIFVVLANAFDLIPANIRKAATTLQSFFTKNMILIIMVGVGIDTDLGELAQAITLSNVVMAFVIVVGAILGSAIIGYLVGFYPIDSAITAGLCMANRGGSGDIAVLGAAERMDLMSYAQLSSRLGGGLVLIIGSIIFGMFLG